MNFLDSHAPDPTVPYTRPSAVLVRKIIAHRDLNAKRKYDKVFYVDEARLGQIRPQWWPVVLGLSDWGSRPIPDNLIDEVIPLWREYLLPGAKLPAGYESCQKQWDMFVQMQIEKYRTQHIGFPHPQDMANLSVEFEKPGEKQDSAVEQEKKAPLIFPDGPDGADVDVTGIAVDAFIDLCDALDEPEIADYLAEKAQLEAEEADS